MDGASRQWAHNRDQPHVTFNEGIMPFKGTRPSGKRAREVPSEVFGEQLESLPIDDGDGEAIEITFTDEQDTDMEATASNSDSTEPSLVTTRAKE